MEPNVILGGATPVGQLPVACYDQSLPSLA